MSRASQIER